jgi:hypothetical protein
MAKARPDPDNPRPSTETDPRFPSGPWTGFWLQRAMPGKHRMRLSLTFVDGRITGAGEDLVGKFSFSGSYDLKTGRCDMIKQYDGAHRLIYEGTNEGERMWLWGIWKMPHDQGGFHLWPEGEEDPTEPRMKAEADLPAALPQRRQLVGAGESSS